MIKLYDSPLSGNVYRVRLFLSLLDLEYESVPIDMSLGEHKDAAYMKPCLSG